MPEPTCTAARVETELRRWTYAYGGEEYRYGEEPGPVARRAVRYHRVFLPEGGAALDLGCGEGQDLAFLAERGYEATGVEFVPNAVRKARRLLEERGLDGRVTQQDLREFRPERRYDLVLAANTLQFLGTDAEAVLERAMEAVAPGGVIGLSLFGREPEEPAVAGTLYFATLEEILARFSRPPGWQLLEAARLWQWHLATNRPEAFVTVVARNTPPARPALVEFGAPPGG